MKKVNEPKKPGRKLVADKMIEKAQSHVDYLQGLVDQYELDVYLSGHNIKGDMVEESMDITPEQVAILGAYTSTKELLDSLKGLKEGKKKPEEGKIIALEINHDTGEKKVLKSDELPPEAIDALKKFLKDME